MKNISFKHKKRCFLQSFKNLFFYSEIYKAVGNLQMIECNVIIIAPAQISPRVTLIEMLHVAKT